MHICIFQETDYRFEEELGLDEKFGKFKGPLNLNSCTCREFHSIRSGGVLATVDVETTGVDPAHNEMINLVAVYADADATKTARALEIQ